MCSIKRIILVAALLVATSCSTQPRPTRPTGPTAEFVAATNSVALRILKTQTASDKNLVFSPLSISLVMSMVYGGARGETAVEMGRALQLDSGLHPQAARVAQQLRGIQYVDELPVVHLEKHARDLRRMGGLHFGDAGEELVPEVGLLLLR